MRSHLTSDQLVDAAEGTPLGDRAASHLVTCAACRARIDDLRASLQAAASVDLPEPSPLFWDHLSTRVHDAVAQAHRQPERRPMMIWTFAASAIAGALLLAAFLLPRPESMRPSPPPLVPVEAQNVPPNGDWLDEPADDASWDLIADLTPELDWEAAGEAGIIRPGTSDDVLRRLSRAEQDELARLLRAELQGHGPSL